MMLKESVFSDFSVVKKTTDYADDADSVFSDFSVVKKLRIMLMMLKNSVFSDFSVVKNYGLC